jgi:putative toxin-antitoxin system antitoxin component (TIGR02293 family)
MNTVRQTASEKLVLTGTVEDRLFDAVFGKHPSDLQLTAMIECGFPVHSVDFLRGEGLTFSEVHDIVLPARTLKHRKDKKQALSAEESDRTLRLARIIALADQVFGNHEKALHRLRGENQRLDGRTPMKLLRSAAGGDLARQMLIQIDEGIYV